MKKTVALVQAALAGAACFVTQQSLADDSYCQTPAVTAVIADIASGKHADALAKKFVVHGSAENKFQVDYRKAPFGFNSKTAKNVGFTHAFLTKTRPGATVKPSVRANNNTRKFFSADVHHCSFKQSRSFTNVPAFSSGGTIAAKTKDSVRVEQSVTSMDADYVVTFVVPKSGVYGMMYFQVDSYAVVAPPARPTKCDDARIADALNAVLNGSARATLPIGSRGSAYAFSKKDEFKIIVSDPYIVDEENAAKNDISFRLDVTEGDVSALACPFTIASKNPKAATPFFDGEQKMHSVAGISYDNREEKERAGTWFSWENPSGTVFRMAVVLMGDTNAAAGTVFLAQ